MSDRALSQIGLTCDPTRHRSPNSIKDIRKQSVKLLSQQSVPNIIEAQTMDTKVEMISQDLNSNQQEMTTGDKAFEEIKRTENSLEVSDTNPSEMEKDVATAKVGFDPDNTRSHRVDILWSVKEGRLPDTDASVSDCVIKSEIKSLELSPKLQQQKPQTALWSFNEKGFFSELDANENQLTFPVVGKKSEEDDQGDRMRRPGFDAFEPRIEDRLARREAINWPWHSGNYIMNIRFHNSEFRTLFSNKIILLKALQWILVSLWTFGAQHIPHFKENSEDLMWTLYITTFFFVTAMLTVRSTNVIDNQASYFIMIVYTLCLAHFCAMMFMYYNSLAIPIVIMTLSATYLLSALTYTCMELDVDSPIVFYPIFVFTIMTSIIAFWVSFAIRGEALRNPLAKIASMWFPCCLVSLIICSAELVEIQALLRGNRTPLQPTDWMLASTFLF